MQGANPCPLRSRQTLPLLGSNGKKFNNKKMLKQYGTRLRMDQIEWLQRMSEQKTTKKRKHPQSEILRDALDQAMES